MTSLCPCCWSGRWWDQPLKLQAQLPLLNAEVEVEAEAALKVEVVLGLMMHLVELTLVGP